MLCRSFKSFVFALALGANTVLAQDSVDSLVGRRLIEYQMPFATQTHGIARVQDTNFVLLSQMSDSDLIKVELDPTT
ncbi:hypothetical protein N7447_006087 [Penicillium robsamsonii]|uniref:uncharacterized protein n=1 Tax=Penicillium robsamsonii TaxID=1792511 RepID=UPI0025493F6D|nr:uncharacterized protein N7447_006087 [Penicillium robsamsonii]KAJ5823747.1 hypothetical protein N7447_006087 [Penicillium robsamsonii]